MPAAFDASEAAAHAQDARDPLAPLRAEFLIPHASAVACVTAGGTAAPPVPRSSPAVYLTGNSLGCQPKAVAQHLTQELEDWARLGVEGHLHGRR